MGTLIGFLKPLEKQMSVKKQGLTIAVAGPTGSGKTIIAKHLAKELELKHISAGQISRKIAEERKIPLEEFSRIREKEVDYEMDRRTLECAMAGGVVIDGRLAGWASGDWADCKIYLECGATARAKRVAIRENLPVSEVRRMIDGRDSEDSKKYAALYGIDVSDKSIYDIVLDTEEYNTIPSAQHAIMKMVMAFLEKPSSHEKNRP